MSNDGKTVTLPEGSISEAMIQDMRSKIGTELRIDKSINNEEATRLAILRFVDGVGDTNPLWRDPEYATRSPYGLIVAPPSWVICCFAGHQFGWTGLGAFHSSSDFTFHLPVLQGDRITPRCTYEGFDGPKPSSFAGQMVIDHFKATYTNQRGELVAENLYSVIKFERKAARATGKHASLEVPHRWDEPELEQIDERVLAETPRGATPRFWDDVRVGDQLDVITKGPIGIADEVAFVAAGGMPIPRMAAHRAALVEYRKHPAWTFRDPLTSAHEPIFAVHYNLHAAHAMGVPMMYDAGFQRQTWQIHLLTDWMGDHGWLTRSGSQYRSFVYLGDVVALGGEVVGRRVDDSGEHVVDLRTWARNQRGEDVMPGTATVALPVRSGDHPVERRLVRPTAS